MNAERRLLKRAVLSVAFFCYVSLASRAAQTDGPIDFYRDIRPIFAGHCLSCHGGVKRKGGLSLSSLTDAMAKTKSGRPLLVRGNPEDSELFRRITHPDPEERMPAGVEPLSESAIQKVRRWIAEGAKWPVHWAFAPTRPVQMPYVRKSNWPRNGIDRFILAALERESIEPSMVAERRTLIRRVCLDLTGLPPSPEEVDHFVNDESSDAYERMVDRLLASPHFGERWGRHWLDLARYADTDGYEVDGERPHAWHWRDWVINAINDDMSIDRFSVEQLAGDLLPHATFSQRLATAFHRQTLVNKEGGIDKEEYRTYAVMDRVNTTATVWLGLTLSCAQCHDHPYDPLSQREYYQWFALFNNADETQLKKGKAVLEVLAERTEPRTTHLLDRGDFLRPLTNKVIQPGTLAVIPSQNPKRPENRLDLARSLVAPTNALTARVIVNHIWMHLFGEGLVRTADDFGVSGEGPSHPELLEWLAQELVRRQWSRKSMIRLIVNSAAYRQSSRHRPELAGLDPENRLLCRQNRYRVQAEAVRDIALHAAGLLSSRVGGPSVFPPIPPDLTKIDFRSDMKWSTSKGEDRYRRGMYTFFKRTLPDPNLTLFDCPDASATAVQRRHSNTPLQALAGLNNEVFVEAAQALAARIMKTCSPVDAAFALALGRAPSTHERTRLTQLFETNRNWYERNHHLTSSTEAAAWTAATSIILNLDEFITRE